MVSIRNIKEYFFVCVGVCKYSISKTSDLEICVCSITFFISFFFSLFILKAKHHAQYVIHYAVEK